jgi:prepilin-type N-terminal cleavage/methylation domain-containing protein
VIESGAQRTSRANGFTLLEVLASAMIFAMVVTVLIGTSSNAVHRVGLSASRLEASLIAEEELALLESFLNTHRTPPDDKEETKDRFAVRVYSEPAVDDFGGGIVGSPEQSGDPGNSTPGSVAGILAAEAPGVDQFLLRYEIRVEWIEGALPETIRRTTYAFDWEGARAALPELFQAGLNPDSNSTGEEDTDRESAPELIPGDPRRPTP